MFQPLLKHYECITFTFTFNLVNIKAVSGKKKKGKQTNKNTQNGNKIWKYTFVYNENISLHLSSAS